VELVEISGDWRERSKRRVDRLQLCRRPVDEVLAVMTSHPDPGSLQQRRALVERREQVADTNQLLTWRASSHSSRVACS